MILLTMTMAQSGSALGRDNIGARYEGNFKPSDLFGQIPTFFEALRLPSSSLHPFILLPEPPATVHDSEDSAHPYDDAETTHTGDGEICGGRSRSGTVWT